MHPAAACSSPPRLAIFFLPFFCPGWQVGWAVGPSTLIRDMQTLLPYVQFCAATPMQEALLRCIQKQKKNCRKNRKKLT